MTSGIYAITNTVTGEQYIGASHKIEQRWYQHRMMLRLKKSQHTKLQIAWLEFGEDAFRFEVLEEVEVTRLAEREDFHQKASLERTGGSGYNTPNLAGQGLWFIPAPDAPQRPKNELVTALTSPEAKRMLRDLGQRWYPNLKRPDGTVLERLIREAAEREEKKR